MEVYFQSRIELRKWFEQNNGSQEALWLLFRKKGKNLLTYSEALEEALCFGWIDSLIKRVDDEYCKQKFTKRRKNSKWSVANKKAVERLIGCGLMHPSGMAAINTAKQNGNWEKPAGSVCKPEMISILENILKNDVENVALFQKLSQARKQEFARFYADAKKAATKDKRLSSIIDKLRGKKGILY